MELDAAKHVLCMYASRERLRKAMVGVDVADAVADQEFQLGGRVPEVLTAHVHRTELPVRRDAERATYGSRPVGVRRTSTYTYIRRTESRASRARARAAAPSVFRPYSSARATSACATRGLSRPTVL